MKKDVYGYGFDIWVFSVLQEYDENKLPVNDELRYEAVAYKGKDSFAFPLCDEPGVFYNITSLQKECGGTLFIRELSSENCDCFNLPWQKTSESDIRSVKIDSDYVNLLEKIIRDIVALSPVRKVYVLIRCQCRGDNNLIGMLTVNQYMDLMRNDKLLGNVAYTVYDPENYLE